MRKYKFARALAWVLVGLGLLIAVIVLFAGVLGMVFGAVSDSVMWGSIGVLAGAQMVPSSLAGLLIALLGFLCHAAFDAAEASIERNTSR